MKKGPDGQFDSYSQGRSLWIAAIVANSIVVLLSIVLTLCCAFTLLTIPKYMKAIDNYDKGELLKVMIIIGGTGWIVGVFGTRLSSRCLRPNGAINLRYIIYSYFGWGAGLFTLLMTSAAFIFLRKNSIRGDLAPGFSVAKYSVDATVHKAIDTIQKDFKCCGNQEHSEWFTVAFTNTPLSNEVAIPESCCNKTPCVKLAPYNDIIKLTPFDRGCLAPLSSYYASVITFRALIMAAIAAFEVIVIMIFCIQVMKLNKKPAVGEGKQLIEK